MAAFSMTSPHQLPLSGSPVRLCCSSEEKRVFSSVCADLNGAALLLLPQIHSEVLQARI